MAACRGATLAARTRTRHESMGLANRRLLVCSDVCVLLCVAVWRTWCVEAVPPLRAAAQAPGPWNTALEQTLLCSVLGSAHAYWRSLAPRAELRQRLFLCCSPRRAGSVLTPSDDLTLLLSRSRVEECADL